MQAEGVGGKGRDNDAFIAAGKLPLEAARDRTLGRRIALPLHVCRIAQQRQHALLAQSAEARKIDHAVLCCGVNFEVARHDDGADRGFDGKGDRVGDGMVHMDEFHRKAAGLDLLPCLMRKQMHRILELMLLQLQLDDAGGQACGVDGASELLHGVGNAANMVFVAMRQEHTAYFVLVFDKIGHIGNDQINAIHLIVREAETAVNDDDILAVFKHGHILADLIQTAKRDDF